LPSSHPPDHFSKQAADYAKHRPLYPEALIRFLADAAPSRNRAWDCATGSGQCARALGNYFKEVIATDLSAEQIAHAAPHPRVHYRRAIGEASGIESRSVDLITVAQAFHWLDFEKFFAEAARVARPNAVIALWCYGLHTISPAIDSISQKYYSDIVGGYWPQEVKWVRERYQTIPFPFTEIPTPVFKMEEGWTLDTVIGNFASWSSTQYYIKDRGVNPIELIRKDLEKAWGDSKIRRRVTWDLFLRAGRVG